MKTMFKLVVLIVASDIIATEIKKGIYIVTEKLRTKQNNIGE